MPNIVKFTSGCGYTEGVSQNTLKAQRILEAAADLESSNAMIQLCSFYTLYDQNGNLIFPTPMHERYEEVLERHHALHKKAASLGDVEGIYKLAIDYLMGVGEENRIVKINTEEGLKLLSVAVEKNHKDAIYSMASRYEMGKDGIMKDLPKALELFEKAYDLQHPEAGINLIPFYRDGLAGEKDSKKFVRLLQECAMVGREECMLDLAMMYIKGDLVEQDVDEAFSWINKIQSIYLRSYSSSSEDYRYAAIFDDGSCTIDWDQTKIHLLSLIQKEKKKKEEENNNNK